MKHLPQALYVRLKKMFGKKEKSGKRLHPDMLELADLVYEDTRALISKLSELAENPSTDPTLEHAARATVSNLIVINELLTANIEGDYVSGVVYSRDDRLPSEDEDADNTRRIKQTLH